MLPRRRTLLLLLTINLFNYIDRQVLAAVLPLLETQLHVSKERLGWCATAFLISYMILSPVFGWLADRRGRWILIALGVGLWSLASGATGLASSLSALLLTRAFVGVGEAAYGPAAPTLIADVYPPEKRAQVLSWFYAAIPVGSALGYVIGGELAYRWGWRVAFWALTPPGLLLAFLAMRMKDPPRRISDQAMQRRVWWRDCAALFTSRSYVLDTLGMTAMSFAVSGVGFWMPSYVDERGGAGDLKRINLVFGVIVVASGLLGALAGGWITDRLRKRLAGASFIVCGVSMLLAVPAFLLMLATPFPAAWVYAFVACFLLFVNTGPSNAILANVTHPSIRATAFAVNILIIHALGDAISPALIGALAVHHGLRGGFEFMTVLIAVGGLFWLWGTAYLDRDVRSASEGSGK